MSKPYPPRLFRRRDDDSIRWKYIDRILWVIRHNRGEWQESRYDDPDHLRGENSDIEEIDSEGRVISDENTGPEWDETAMMQAGKL